MLPLSAMMTSPAILRSRRDFCAFDGRFLSFCRVKAGHEYRKFEGVFRADVGLLCHRFFPLLLAIDKYLFSSISA